MAPGRRDAFRQRGRGSSAALVMVLVAAAAALLASTLPPAAAAPLPLHLRWLQGVVPPSAAGPPLRAYFQALPKELCKLGPDGIEALPVSVMDEICPLKAANRLGRVLPGLTGLADDATIEKVAQTPVNVGGALMLLGAETSDEAADVQKKICNVLMYPKQTCGFKSGEALGPLYYHLDTRDTVVQWLASNVVPIAVAPLSASLATLPDVLCQVPMDQLVNMPKSISSQLCPKDVAVVPVVTLFAMGRTGSNALEAKLCDLLKRPQEACKDGKYNINPATEKRIEQVKIDTENAVYSWEPVVPDLPKITMPANLTSMHSKEALDSISKWWQNETIPELRRYTMRSFVPLGLQPLTAAMVEQLPASICALTPSAVAGLPTTFKQQVCPIGSLLQQAQDQAGTGLHSWGYTLAEVAMGATNPEPVEGSRARVDAWLMRMCSVVYAPDVACSDPGSRTANLADLVAQRISQQNRPLTLGLISQALGVMPKVQREFLMDGLGKQLANLSPRASALPRNTLFGPFCTLMSTTASTTDADLHQLLVATAVDTVKNLPLLGSIASEEEAYNAAARICGPLAAKKQMELAVSAVKARSRFWPQLPHLPQLLQLPQLARLPPLPVPDWIPTTPEPQARPDPGPGSRHPAVKVPGQLGLSYKSPAVELPLRRRATAQALH